MELVIRYIQESISEYCPTTRIYKARLQVADINIDICIAFDHVNADNHFICSVGFYPKYHLWQCSLHYWWHQSRRLCLEAVSLSPCGLRLPHHAEVYLWSNYQSANGCKTSKFRINIRLNIMQCTWQKSHQMTIPDQTVLLGHGHQWCDAPNHMT